MRALVVAAVAVVVVACGGAESSVNTAQLNRIAFQHNQVEDTGRTARLEPLGAFAAPPGFQGQVCRFTRGGDILVIAYDNVAAARIDATLRMFRTEAEIGPLGGFYRDNELALSIGVETGEPARARVTNRVTETQEDVRGAWACERHGT